MNKISAAIKGVPIYVSVILVCLLFIGMIILNTRVMKGLTMDNTNTTTTVNTEGDGHPIPSELVDNIDVMSVTKSGEVTLVIVVAGYLNDSSYTEERVIEKINNYLHYINSSDFEEEFGAPSVKKTNIVLHCTQKPHDSVFKLLQEIQRHVNSANASLSIEIKNHSNLPLTH